jgi:hypothetical protein
VRDETVVADTPAKYKHTINRTVNRRATENDVLV